MYKNICCNLYLIERFNFKIMIQFNKNIKNIPASLWGVCLNCECTKMKILVLLALPLNIILVGFLIYSHSDLNCKI